MNCKFSQKGACVLASPGFSAPCAGEGVDKMNCPFWSLANSLIAIRKGL